MVFVSDVQRVTTARGRIFSGTFFWTQYCLRARRRVELKCVRRAMSLMRWIARRGLFSTRRSRLSSSSISSRISSISISSYSSLSSSTSPSSDSSSVALSCSCSSSSRSSSLCSSSSRSSSASDSSTPSLPSSSSSSSPSPSPVFFFFELNVAKIAYGERKACHMRIFSDTKQLKRNYLHDQVERVASATHSSCTAEERLLRQHSAETIESGEVVCGIVSNASKQLHQRFSITL